MAKADVVLPGGAKVTVTGTVDEVASLLAKLSADDDGVSARKPRSSRRKRRGGSGSKAANKPKQKSTGPTDYVRDLIGEGYFKTKREIAAVRDKLEERAHIYPVTSISGPLYRLVKSKELRRIKEGGAWKYVNP